MKVTIKIEKEVELSEMEVQAAVRYWDDAAINGEDYPESGEGFPCKEGDCWHIVIDIETGRILNWPIGNNANVNFKVCDCCRYSITDQTGQIVISHDGYVPDVLSPGGEGYGDYIIMEIDEDGIIQNWNKEKIHDILDANED